ncbi:hypothetical protein WR25_05263 isoform A [Diploscapter pachys]|uniref:mRNA decay factor PAT1 domain-containing protein n=1 Tax=Diploscapter pachys TaxID=2018661 RepID=A0A2A2LSD9_9BILA|nr:hypothetical protein WR25_05263 isoform A [Diploscapter pachys]
MDKLGGARTLEDIESELMFGTLPESDDENGLELDQDEIDAINDETFGGEVAGNDAELEDYAAQTASLRLDDPVWDSAGGGLAEPDASQIPMPVFDSTSFDNLTFGTSPLNSMLAGNFAKGLWDPSSNGLFNLWGESAGKADGQGSSIFGDLTGKEDSKTDPLAAQLLESSRFGLFGDVPSSSAIQKPATSTRKPDDVNKVQQQMLEDSRIVRPSAHGYKQPILGEQQTSAEEAFPRLVPQPETPSSRPEVQPHHPQPTQILPSPIPGIAKPPPLPPQAMSAEELERQLLQQNAHTSTANQENSAARIFDLLMPKNIPSTSAKQPQPSPVPGQIPPQLAALQSGQPIPGIAPTQPPPQIPKHGPGTGATVRPPPNQDVMPPLPMVLPPQAPQAAHAYMANLPPLAALPPTFAQLVPIWLVRLTGRTQHLPPTVPPIPSIIGQMYQQVKDPQAVLAITHVLINRGMALQSMHYQQQQAKGQGQEGKSNGPNQSQPPFGGPNRMPILPPEMIAQMRAAGIPMPAPFANQQQSMMPGLPPHLQRSHNQTPTSGMQSGRSSVFQRKPPGMPSVRTIEDLALDQYAGYMSFKEKEWLMKIQTLQCQGPTQDPMIEDYYYTLWKAKKVAEGGKSEQKAEKQQHVEKRTETRQSKDNINDEIRERYRERCRINGERRREEREREKAERRKAREQEKEQSEPRETTTKKEVGSKFAGSLGLPSKSTTNNPRHLIKVGATEMTEEEIARRLASTQKRLRTLLMRLESAILVIIECQDLRSQAPNDQSVQAEISKKIDLILKELFGDELSKVIQINKGRALISRLLKVAAPKDQARAIISMISMAKNVRKGVMEDVISDVVPSIYASAMGMSRDQMILILSAINVDQLKIDLAEKNLFTREILLTLLLACSKKKASNISLKLFQWLLGPTTNIDWSSGWSSSLASWRQLLKLNDDDVILLVEWLKLLSLDETSQTIAVQIAAALQTVL